MLYAAGKLRVLVSFLALTSAPLVAQSAPSISSISPNPAGVGMTVTLTGTNFGSSGTVTFNGVAASPTTWNSTTIVTPVPVGASSGNVVVTVGGQASNSFNFTVNNGPVSYIYDDLGRLVGVIDVLGNAATYSYDAVGNILSITRLNPNQVSIMQFSPKGGPLGASVTISGTGFSSTPGQNTVKFNGTTAAVTSASTFQLQVTVPAGATTGTISVTSPNGTASSTSNFTVTAGSGIPSITSFSPTSGAAGTAVNVTGVNFDPTLSNNKLRMNVSQAVISSATTTTIATAVPTATGSGHFTVITPGGAGVSTQDFYVPYGTHAPGDIGFTARMTIGGTQTVTLGTASKIGMVLFDAVAGQHVSVQPSSSTFPTCAIYLAGPDNGTLGSTGCTQNLNSTFLQKTGTYAIVLDPSGGTGGINLALTSDFVGTITPGGPPVTVTTTKQGEYGRLTFSAVANQHITANITSPTYPSCTITLNQPNGSTLTSASCSTANFWDIGYLPVGGVYTFIITPSASSTGSVTVQLNNITDFTSPITIDGATVTATTSVVGQDARLSFSASGGQRIVVFATSVTNPSATLNLVRPDGSIQTYLTINNNPSGQTFFIDTQTLTMAGPYQLWVKHSGSNVGSETLQVKSVPADFTGTLVMPAAGATGATLRVPTTGNLSAGQNATLSFSGTAGQRASFNVTAASIGSYYTSCNLSVYDPTHTLVTSGYCGTGAPNYIDSVKLNSTGTYTVVVDPQGPATGSVSVSINNDSDVTGTITIDGSAVTATTAVAGQDARLSFTATANQRIVVFVTNVTNPQATVYLVKPDGTNQTSLAIYSGQTYFMDTLTLAAAGTYQLWVQHSSTSFGSETLQIASVPADFSGTLTVPAAGGTGTAVRVPTSGNLAAGQNGTLTFSGTTGQKLSFNVISPTIGSAYYNCILRVYDPNSTQITFGNCGPGSPSYIDTVTLASTGTYKILIDPQAGATGSVSLSINNDSDATGSITIDGSAVTATTTVAGQDARLSFSATASQRIVVYATSVSNPSATVYLVLPNGNNQASFTINNSPSGQTFFLDTQTLATTGTYQLWVQHSGTNIGSETLRVASVPADVTGSLTMGGAALPITTVAGQNANITFTNSTSQSVTVHWASGTYSTSLGCYLRVTGPSPSNTQVGFAYCNAATGTASLGTVAAGTYNILVDPQAQNAGGLSLTVTTP